MLYAPGSPLPPLQLYRRACAFLQDLPSTRGSSGSSAAVPLPRRRTRVHPHSQTPTVSIICKPVKGCSLLDSRSEHARGTSMRDCSGSDRITQRALHAERLAPIRSKHALHWHSAPSCQASWGPCCGQSRLRCFPEQTFPEPACRNQASDGASPAIATSSRPT